MIKRQAVQLFLLRRKTILVLYIFIAIIASLHLISLGTAHAIEGTLYTDYNNYLIFKQSFYHLLSKQDLYVLYPAEHWDLYKYSPSFALAMGALAYLPDWIGLSLWNVVNALALFIAITRLPLQDKKINLMLWFVLLELLTSLQSAQSNALMAGMLIGALTLMEKRRAGLATLLIVGATFIKVYGAIGFAIFLFYPEKVKFILYAALWSALFLVLPLVVLSPAELISQYESWAAMMSKDQSVSYGFSVMGWLHSWFGLSGVKNLVILTGVILFFIPVVRLRLYKEVSYRLLFLAYMLVWVIIFNHKAESSTFVIEISAIAIWYFAEEPTRWRTVLLWLVFIFSSLSATDLFPHIVRSQVMVPYVVKVVPCILLWCVMFYELVLAKKQEPAVITGQVA